MNGQPIVDGEKDLLPESVGRLALIRMIKLTERIECFFT
jgi:hypothetical protein